MKKNSLKITASGLRIALISSIGLIIMLAGVGFWFFQGALTTVAESVNSYNLVAASTSKDVQQLRSLKREMDQNPIAVTRAQKIIADKQHYQYQIIDDLTTYARDAGFTISGFTFTEDAPATASAKAASGAAAAPNEPTVSGAKTATAQVFFSDKEKERPTYQSFMNFLKSVEQNLTKMEVQGVSLKLSDGDNTAIQIDPLLIKVFIKQ